MKSGLDSVVSSLLCEEDNDLIFDDFDCVLNQQKDHQDHVFDYDDPYLIELPVLNDECFTLMLKRECEHLAARDYLDRLRNGDLDFEARLHAIDWIGKVHAYFNFGPLCLYLSINYLDRFLSIYELPKGKAWMMQLLAVACLSIAAKMEETEMPLTLDLQVGESRFLFEGKTIQRMELLVLSTLKWRMQAITPFSYIDYFLRKIYNDKTPSKSSICRSIHLISSLIKGIDFLEFRPSEIAAAVALSVADESVEREESIYQLLTQHLEKERLFKCVELINGLYLVRVSSTKVPSSISPSPSIPQSPIGVLDAACLSYKRDESTSPSSPKAKRRKVSIPLVLEF